VQTTRFSAVEHAPAAIRGKAKPSKWVKTGPLNSYQAVFSVCCEEIPPVDLEEGDPEIASTRGAATMCWVILPSHRGRANASPF
jgi:hypothetical protein